MPVTERDFDAYQRWSAIHARSASTSSSATCEVLVIASTRVSIGIDELEPEEPAGTERKQVWELAEARKAGAPEQLDRVTALERAKVQLHRLRETRDVVD